LPTGCCTGVSMGKKNAISYFASVYALLVIALFLSSKRSMFWVYFVCKRCHRSFKDTYSISASEWAALVQERRASVACDYTSSELHAEEAEAALGPLLAGPGALREGEPPLFLSVIMLREPWEWFLSAANWVSDTSFYLN
jgi:hypothetical protein